MLITITTLALSYDGHIPTCPKRCVDAELRPPLLAEGTPIVRSPTMNLNEMNNMCCANARAEGFPARFVVRGGRMRQFVGGRGEATTSVPSHPRSPFGPDFALDAPQALTTPHSSVCRLNAVGRSVHRSFCILLRCIPKRLPWCRSAPAVAPRAVWFSPRSRYPPGTPHTR